VTRAGGLALGLVLTAAASCRTSEGEAAMEIRPEFRPGTPLGGDPPWANEVFAAAIAEGKAFEIASASDHPVVVQVDAAEVSASVARLQLTLQGAPEPELADLEATVEVEREAGAIVWREDAPLLLRRGLAVLAAEIALARGEDRHARKLLQGADPELALLALEWATKERRVTVLEVATPWLRHPDLRVAGAAIDYFGAVGSAEHAKDLANAAKLFDREHTGRLYAALGAVGGADAVAFLAFAVRNEDDPLLAELARQALLRAQETPRAVPSPPKVARGHRSAP